MGRVVGLGYGYGGRAEKRRRDATRPADRRYRVGLWSYVLGSDAATALTSPLVYLLLVPFALLDVTVAVYQAICFRAWGVARVHRGSYFAIDRHTLGYLNGLEKLNCLYCSYANGVLAFVREVASRTEQYWCPIRHARQLPDPHPRYESFARYGDAASYRATLPQLRTQLKK